MDTANAHIRQALRTARELLALADEGDLARTDDGCGVLFGVMRDCAYRIRAEAERERDEHKLRGEWNGERAGPTRREDSLAKHNGKILEQRGAGKKPEKAKGTAS